MLMLSNLSKSATLVSIWIRTTKIYFQIHKCNFILPTIKRTVWYLTLFNLKEFTKTLYMDVYGLEQHRPLIHTNTCFSTMFLKSFSVPSILHHDNIFGVDIFRHTARFMDWIEHRVFAMKYSTCQEEIPKS